MSILPFPQESHSSPAVTDPLQLLGWGTDAFLQCNLHRNFTFMHFPDRPCLWGLRGWAAHTLLCEEARAEGNKASCYTVNMEHKIQLWDMCLSFLQYTDKVGCFYWFNLPAALPSIVLKFFCNLELWVIELNYSQNRKILKKKKNQKSTSRCCFALFYFCKWEVCSSWDSVSRPSHSIWLQVSFQKRQPLTCFSVNK